MDRPRILFVTTHDPRVTTTGGHQRTHHLHRALSKAGEVDTLRVGRRVGMLGVEEDPGSEPAPPDLQDLRAGSPWDRAVSAALPWRRRARRRYGRRERVARAYRDALAAGRYNVVVGRYFQSLAWAQAWEGGAPLLLDVDDLPDALILERAGRAGSARRRASLALQAREVRRLLRAGVARCREAWVAKEADRAALGLDCVRVLPNLPFLPAAPDARPPPPAAATLLFVGNLRHRINTEAVTGFLRGPWREVLREVPEARLRIVGSQLEPAQREAWARHPNVEVVGFARDLAPHYRDCAFSIVPIWRGSGTKIKVLESLAHGRTAVVARPAHRGFEAEYRAGDCLLDADDPAAFAGRCVALLRDPALRDRLAARGREAVVRCADPGKFDEIVVSAVGRCTVARRDP